MKYWSSQFDMAKMPRTFLWTFFASLTVVLAIDSSKARVINTFCPGSLALFILRENKVLDEPLEVSFVSMK